MTAEGDRTARVAPRRPHVLVCDDDPWIRQALGEIVAAHGYRATLVDSGTAALAAAARERPDVVLLDLMMPGLDGWATAAALRRQPATSDVPVVIVSALSRNATDPVAADVVAWLEKPMDIPALIATIRDAVGPRRPPRILVVEPSAELADRLRTSFERHGLVTDVAGSAPEAVALLERTEPDLLVLDLALDDCDGVLERLRSGDSLRRTQMLVYSAAELAGDKAMPETIEARVLDLLGCITCDGDGSML